MTTKNTHGLDAALAAIDRALPLNDVNRRVLRAAACFNYGDNEAWAREMRAAIAEVRDMAGLSPDECRRLIMPPAVILARQAQREEARKN